MTKQEFLKEFNRRKFYYLEYNNSMYAELLNYVKDNYNCVSDEERSEFLDEVADVSVANLDKLVDERFYGQVQEYANTLDPSKYYYYEKVNEFIDELEKEHPLNSSLIVCRIIYSEKYKGFKVDKSLSYEDNIRRIAECYEADDDYDNAHKVYCFLEDYKSARRVRYCQAIALFYKDDFEKAKYYFQCALDYDDAQEYVEHLENAPKEYERFKREVPRDFLCKRLKELQPELYNEYMELYNKNAAKSKESPRISKKLSKLYDKLYEYVPELEEELIERYSEKVGEDIVLHWLGELPVIDVH